MAAKVNPGDRKKTGFDDGSYSVETQAQCYSAIRLAGNSKTHSRSQVLAHVAARARKMGWKNVLAKVAAARGAK